MKSEKGISAKDALNNLENDLTMNNDTSNQNKFQFNSRRELLEQSKLSRLPERKSFKLPDFSFQETPSAVAVCVNCGGRLDVDDTIQQSVKVCRKCLTQYAVIDSAIDDAAKRKRREMLERFAPEVNNAR